MRRFYKKFVLPFFAATFQICVLAPNLLGQVQAVSPLEEQFRQLIVSSQQYVVTVIAQSYKIYLEETVQKTDSAEEPRPIIRPVMNKNVGSGLVVDSRGIVLTRKSIINDMKSISVVLHSGETLAAEVLGIDDNRKIAVLKTRGMQLKNPSFAHDRGLKIGNWVFLMGNLQEAGPTVSIALVEAILGEESVLIGARAWRGSSGTPVFNMSGQVLGILAARMELSEDVAGLTGVVGHDEYVVIPISSLLPSIASIADRRMAPVAWIGMTITRDGFKVTYIFEDSPAEEAGVEVGDQVLSLNNRRIESLNDVSEIVTMIQQSQVNDSVRLELKRGNAVLEKQVQIKLRSPAYNPQMSQRR